MGEELEQVGEEIEKGEKEGTRQQSREEEGVGEVAAVVGVIQRRDPRCRSRDCPPLPGGAPPGRVGREAAR